MRLPLVQKKKSKKPQPLDTIASVAKAWGEWQLAKGAVKTAKRAPWKLIGAVTAALAAVGLGAKKLRGGGKSDDATPPPPPAYTGPVADPNAPGASDSNTVGASPSGPVAPTSTTPDPEAPKTPDK
ncbi:MAG: hypothetical protein QOG77_2640 [Solirubrobacteraceae bacterium]|nr:hypothetical protein [Solirubrobacteraceae bacterium]